MLHCAGVLLDKEGALSLECVPGEAAKAEIVSKDAGIGRQQDKTEEAGKLFWRRSGCWVTEHNEQQFAARYYFDSPLIFAIL